MKIKAHVSLSSHVLSHLSAAVLRLVSFASPSEVKKSGGDLCRCMHRNSSRPYDVVLLLQHEQLESERVGVHAGTTYVFVSYSCLYTLVAYYVLGCLCVGRICLNFSKRFYAFDLLGKSGL